MWGTLSDERTGLSFTIASNPFPRDISKKKIELENQKGAYQIERTNIKKNILHL
jgi:hypothetical protein